MRAASILWFLTLSAVLWAAADGSQRRFQRLTTRDGLSSNEVADVVKDTRGFLWVCGADGIQRYDGSSFRTFRLRGADSVSLPGSNFTSAFILDSNRILFFEFSGHVACYDYRTGALTDLSRRTGIDSLNVNSAFRDSRNRLWFAATDGLVLFDSTGLFIRTYPIAASLPEEATGNSVNMLREDASGRLWLAMFGKGIFLFDPVTGRYSAPWKRTLYNIQVHTIEFSSDRWTAWAATGGKGILTIDAATLRPEHLSRTLPRRYATLQFIPSLYLQGDTILWAGTMSGLLEICLKDRSVLLHRSVAGDAVTISNDVVVGIADFNDGMLWFATRKGLNRLSTRPSRFQVLSQDHRERDGLPANSVNVVWTDRQRLQWFGSAKGLSVRSRSDERMAHYPLSGRKDVSVISILRDRENMLWLGTWGDGLFRAALPARYRPGDSITFRQFTAGHRPGSLPADFIKAIAEGPDGGLIFATWGGGISVLPRSERTRPTPYFRSFRAGDGSGLVTDYTAALCADPFGRYWVATGSELQRWDVQSGHFTRQYIDPSNITSQRNRATTITAGPDSVLWIGTASGLARVRFSGNGSPVFDTPVVDVRYFIYQTVVDRSGAVWFGTPHSLLHRYDPAAAQLRSYDLTHEANSYEFGFGMAFSDDDGLLNFTGTDGVLQFHPEQFRTSDAPPPLTVTDLTVDGAPYDASVDISRVTGIQLPYDRNDVGIGFAALTYERPEGVEYEYQLEGAGQEWTATGNRTTVTFANLAPGAYRFRVRATNDDRSWSVNSLPLSIIITPPFWETAWFRIGALSILITLASILVRRRIRMLLRERQRQQEFSRQLIDTQEGERKRIASELHDGIGQNLLIISNALQSILIAKRRRREELERITDLAKETVKEVRSVAANLHPHQLERLGFARAVRSMVEQASRGTGVTFTVRMPDPIAAMTPDRQIHLYRILQELTNNILKHAGATEASVAFEAGVEDIRIDVRDNGRGIPAGRSGDGFGMTSLAERVRLLRGTMEIRSAPGAGTAFTIIIPHHG